MEITLYNFSKRSNSTKQPTGGVTRTVRLKGQCDIYNPSFFITGTTGYNYLRAWGGYYYINRIAYDIDGAEYIDCTLDVLATYKSYILSTKAYVKYSSSNYNTKIIDQRITPLEEEIVINTTDMRHAIDGLTLYNENYKVILTVANTHGVTNYYMSQDLFVSSIISLMTANTSLLDSLVIQFGDAWGSISRARLVPFTNLETGSDITISFGTLDLAVPESSPRLTNKRPGLIEDSFVLPISNTYNDFRKGDNNFTKLELYLPFVGTIELNPFDLLDSDSVDIEFIGNALTGNCIYKVMDDNGIILGTYSGSFGMDIPISQLSMNNPLLPIQGTANLATSIVGGNVTSSAIAQTAVSSLKGMGTTASVLGGYSGNYGELLSNYASLTVKNRPSRNNPEDFLELYGGTCNQVLQLSTLTGYVETVGISIDVPTSNEMRLKLNQLVDNGIYIE